MLPVKMPVFVAWGARRVKQRGHGHFRLGRERADHLNRREKLAETTLAPKVADERVGNAVEADGEAAGDRRCRLRPEEEGIVQVEAVPGAVAVRIERLKVLAGGVHPAVRARRLPDQRHRPAPARHMHGAENHHQDAKTQSNLGGSGLGPASPGLGGGATHLFPRPLKQAHEVFFGK